MKSDDRMKQHLTTDQLVDRLYGIEPGDHIDDCHECAERFLELQERKEMAAQPLPASYEFLAAQRRSIYARMGERPQARMRWVPALAAALCLVAAGVFGPDAFVHHPVAQVVAKPVVVDPQLFSDVYSMEQSMEPLAAQPIHALFDQE
jgi:hypothetical protein